MEIWGISPQKYRNPIDLSDVRYCEVMAHLMQGDVDRDSKSGDENATIGLGWGAHAGKANCGLGGIFAST